MYALTLPVNAFQGVVLRLMFLLSILLVHVLYVFCTWEYMSYDLDPQLLNCGLSSTSLIKGGGAGGAYDPDAQRGAKSEMMWIEHGNVSRDTLTGVQWEWGSTRTRRESNQRNWFCLRYENILFSPPRLVLDLLGMPVWWQLKTWPCKVKQIACWSQELPVSIITTLMTKSISINTHNFNFVYIFDVDP